MLSVIEAKINRVKRLVDSGIGTKVLRQFINRFDELGFQMSLIPEDFGGFEKYFDNDILARFYM